MTTTPIAHTIWDMKYRLKGPDGNAVDANVEATWCRVAQALATPEPEDQRSAWEAQFMTALADYRFLPAGRILAGAGAEREVTLFNCFVMGTIADDMTGIFDALKESALTMQAGGGIGCDFSTLRPKGAPVKGVGADASGPLTFMDVWDAMCRTIMSAGHRRGAMMAVMRCDHPDIEAFIAAKRDPGRLRMFNLSVLATDAFMAAVKVDAPWDLVFERTVYNTVRARDLWDRIMHATYDYAEPGVIFIDRVNRLNNLAYCETIAATNPCGEEPLPPHGACLLGSINLTRFIKRPFEADAALDEQAFDATATTAVRMMDNAIDASRYALDAQRHEAEAKRRIGLGITGLANALIMMGVRYGSEQATALTQAWLKRLQRTSYLASANLAAEKGAFPLYDREAYLAGESVQTLDTDVREAIAEHGIRNALLTSIAPTGTISLLAGNVSSGIEPVFAFSFTRNVRQPDGTERAEEVSDYALRLFRQLKGEDAPLPDSFVDAQKLRPSDHVAMQAAAQAYIDSAISKTTNVPRNTSFESFKAVYLEAYEKGCKGCTTYRPNEITGAVLEVHDGDGDEPRLPLTDPTADTPDDEYDAGGIIPMTQPLDRPEVLPGLSYKLNWPESDHAIYVTLNDVVREARRRPFEIFINSKNMDHYAWSVALTRMISAVFRRGGDVSFVVDELKAVFDPRGGQWMEGSYVPSLLAAIGGVIETHMRAIGFIKPQDEPAPVHRLHGPRENTQTVPDICPRCAQPSILHQQSCDMCTSCGYSNCA